MSSHPPQSNETLIDAPLWNHGTVRPVSHPEEHRGPQAWSCRYVQALIASAALFLYLIMNPIASSWPKQRGYKRQMFMM